MTELIIDTSSKKSEAVSYYRQGNLDKARELYLEILRETSDLDERLALTNNLAMIERERGNLDHALTIHLLSSPLVDISRNHLYQANYFNGLANTYQQKGETDKALIEYEAARFHFEQAGNDRFLAGVENNIAFLLIKIGQAEDALIHLDEARRLFIRIGEPYRVAEVDDTRAQAFDALGNKPEALKAGMASYLALYDSDERLALEKTKETLRKILA